MSKTYRIVYMEDRRMYYEVELDEDLIKKLNLARNADGDWACYTDEIDDVFWELEPDLVDQDVENFYALHASIIKT